MPPLKVIAPALTGLATVALTAHFFASPMFQDSLSECAIHHRGPYFVAFGNNIPLGSAVDGLFCALFAAFNNIAQTLLGKSIGVMFASIYLPVQALMLILGAQQGPGHVALAIGLIAVGQLITIGVTLNIVWLPYFWNVLKRQASSGAEAAPRIVAPAIAISLAATVPVLLPTFAINAAHPIWIWGNFAFQLFPVLLLPVVQATAQARGKEANPSYRPYVSLLRSLAIFAGVLWWVGILQALLDYDLPYAKEVAGMEKSPALMSPLLSKTLGIPHLPLRLRPTLAAEFNEGARFLLADMVAIVVAVGAATALHNEKLGSRGDKPARASVFSLLGGPGAWFMSYWASVFEHEASSTKTKKQR